MAHPLEEIMRAADGFLLIGESGKDRFPGYSYNAFTQAKKRFYCLDLDGMTESRGPTKGGKVYASVAELPDDHDDLAIIWVTPSSSARAVEVAKEAGCTRVWFSFGTASRQAFVRDGELDVEVVEAGRCPIYYFSGAPAACKGHTAMVRISGTRRGKQRTTVEDRGREMW